METGDILLFSPKQSKGMYWFIDKIIQYFSDSKYTHAAMIWKDPILLDKERLSGFYILESTGKEAKDVEDGKLKFGAQLRSLNEVFRNSGCDVYWRKLICNRDQQFFNNMDYAHSIVHNKPYDLNPIDWIDALVDKEYGNNQKTYKYYCSALCSFVLVCLGALPKDTPWSIVRPKDLGTEPGARNVRKRKHQRNSQCCTVCRQANL